VCVCLSYYCYTGIVNSARFPGRNLHKIKFDCSSEFAVTECLGLTGYESPSTIFHNSNLSEGTGKKTQYSFESQYAGRVGLKVCNLK
jgi:hypothetical protein